MEKERIHALLLESGVIPIFRFKDTRPLLDTCEALVAGGINTFEITMGVPDAVDAIQKISKKFGPNVLLGAGTVLDPETARMAILAGAEYIVTPSLNLDVIQMAHRYSRPVAPGALTPTEALTAWEAGADFVKIFPIRSFGPQYLKDLLAPLPQLRLVAVGGVTVENAADYIRAGAVAVGMGSELLDKTLIGESKFDLLAERAGTLSRSIKAARKEVAA